MTRPRPILFGEVLFDRFPDGEAVLGGAPFNVAWHLAAFGLAPLFVSRVGDDELGRAVLEAMRIWGMETAGVQVDGAHPTGVVEVRLADGQPTYEILPEQAYDHIRAGDLPRLAPPVLLCHGTLALRARASREALDRLMDAAAPRRLVDVNLRAPWWGRDEVLSALASASILKLNEAELLELADPAAPLEAAARELMDACAADRVVVTRGERGFVAVDRERGRLDGEPARAVDVVDTVGAGDAFTSVLILGECLGWDLAATLRRALDFAEAIVGRRGATTCDRGLYTPFLSSWELS